MQIFSEKFRQEKSSRLAVLRVLQGVCKASGGRGELRIAHLVGIIFAETQSTEIKIIECRVE